MTTIDGRTYLPNGIEIKSNPDGVVLWASDWVSLFAAAHKGEHGLTVRKGGFGTMGHVDVIMGGNQ